MIHLTSLRTGLTNSVPASQVVLIRPATAHDGVPYTWVKLSSGGVYARESVGEIEGMIGGAT